MTIILLQSATEMCDYVKEVIAEEKCMQKIAAKQFRLRKSYPCEKIYCSCKTVVKKSKGL